MLSLLALGAVVKGEKTPVRQLGTAGSLQHGSHSSGASCAEHVMPWASGDRHTSLSCKFWNTSSSQSAGVTPDFVSESMADSGLLILFFCQ